MVTEQENLFQFEVITGALKQRGQEESRKIHFRVFVVENLVWLSWYRPF